MQPGYQPTGGVYQQQTGGGNYMANGNVNGFGGPGW